jgi:hypothetical protein
MDGLVDSPRPGRWRKGAKPKARRGAKARAGPHALPVCLWRPDPLSLARAPRQAIESRLQLAGALARQWFGAFMRPAAAVDQWLVDGLAGYLSDQYVRKFMGANELAYRYRWRRGWAGPGLLLAVLPCEAQSGLQ